MIFTRDQIEEIRKKLFEMGVTDLSMPEADTPLSGTEVISLVQNGVNKKINISDFWRRYASYFENERWEAYREAEQAREADYESLKVMINDGERSRNQAEQERSANEAARLDAEEDRYQAETLRQQEFKQIKSQLEELIEEGGIGEVNVQADWNEDDYTKDSYIQNKPDVYTSSQTDSAIRNAIRDKTDKVSSAVSGDIATLDANGNLTDSGKKVSDFAPQSSTYTKQEVDAAIEAIDVSSQISGKADKSEMNVSTNGDKTTITLKTGTYAEVINQHQDISGKADKSDTYTKAEIGNLITPIDSEVIVGALPASGEANKVYRVPGTDSYTDYAWNGTQFVPLATFDGDLTAHIGYYVSDSAWNAATKIVTAPGFQLNTGCNIRVKFNNYTGIAAPKLNVNNTGAKDIYLNGSIAGRTNMWKDGDVIEFYYDGNAYWGNILSPQAIKQVVYAKTLMGYESDILDLWLDDTYLDGVNRINFRCYSTEYLLRAYTTGTTALWTARESLSAAENGKVFAMHATINGVVETVGYVIFNDVDSFKSKSTTTIEDFLYLPWVTEDIRKHKYIYEQLNAGEVPVADDSVGTTAIKDFAVTHAKIADKYVIADANGDVRGMIRELYVIPEAMGSITDLVVKAYNGAFYVRPLASSTTYGWQAMLNINQRDNGVIYPLTVTTEGTLSDYHVGDVVGYVVYSDVAALRQLMMDGNPKNGIISNITDITQSPIIYAYLLSQNVDIEGVIKYPDIQLPSDIYIVRGDELRVYYRSILKTGTPDNYDIRVVSSVGKSFPKYYQLISSEVGNYTATFNLYDNDNSIVKSASTTIHVINPMSAPLSNKNVLVMGASATASGYIAGELRRRLTTNTGDGTSQNPTGLNLGNITFVGRKRGNAVDVPLEATGGWSWRDYAGEGRAAYRFYVTGVTQLNIGDVYTQSGITLTVSEINVTGGTGNIRCVIESGTGTPSASGTLTRVSGSGDATISYTSYESESFTPFWNPNKAGGAGLDFVNYANEYCNGSIDILISHCGINDMNRYNPNNMQELFTDYIKPFVRAYHTDFPNGKFIISTLPTPSPTGGMAANYGANITWSYLPIQLRLLAFAKEAWKMAVETEFSGYVVIADDMPVFDAEHSYPSEQAVVNTRSTVTAERGTNGVHPLPLGSYQVADAIYARVNGMEW